MTNPHASLRSTGKILTLGACAWTTLFQVEAWPSGSAKIIPKLAIQIGDGMSASAACSIAALGGGVTWWGRVSKDANGLAAINSIAETGVDCSQVLWVDGVSGSFCTVLIDDSGERLVVPRHDPAMPESAQWLALDQLPQYALVLTEVRWHAGALAILKEARRIGIPGLLDAEVSGPGQLAALCQVASHLLFSETGLAHWLNLPISHFSSAISTGLPALTVHVEAALRQVLDHTPCALAGVTLGSAGFYWMERQDDRQDRLHHVEAPTVTVVDTLAAGDVFHGAYAWAMTQSIDSGEWARIATTAASLKCQHFGGRLGAPSFSRLQNALLQNAFL